MYKLHRETTNSRQVAHKEDKDYKEDRTIYTPEIIRESGNRRETRHG